MRRATLRLLVVIAALLLAPRAFAQRSGWSAPMELSPQRLEPAAAGSTTRTYGSAWLPALTTDPLGGVHAFWYSGIALAANQGGSLDLLMYRSLHDGVWSPVREAAAPATGGYTVRVRVAVARDGFLHAIYRRVTEIVYSKVPFEQAGDSAAWSEPQRISGFDAAYYVDLAADSKGTLHAFWSEAVNDPNDPSPGCQGCSDLFYRRSSDGGISWSVPVNLSRSPDGENRQHVVIDNRDRIHVAWDEGIDWYASLGVPKTGVYMRSDDGGQSWTAPTHFRLPPAAVRIAERQQAAAAASGGRPTPGPAGASAPTTTARQDPPLDAVQQTTVGVDRAGNPLIVYRGVAVNQLYSQYSPDGGASWLPPVEIAGLQSRASDLDAYSMATDGAGNIHLLATGYLPNEDADDPTLPPGLWHLTWNGSGWSGREPVMRNELYPEYPRLVVANGNELHAIWYTRSREDLFDSARARYKIWYSGRAAPAPRTQALPLFTPVPTVAAALVEEPTPAPTVAPTALPSELAAAPPMSGRPVWEGSGLGVLVIAILSAVGFFGAVFGLMFFIRGRRR